jgi:hypothetical protein
MATEEKAKLSRTQRIAVFCNAAYVLRAQVKWQDDKGAEHATGWSGDVPVGQKWVVDMATQQGITTGRKMWPYIDIRGGGYMSGETVEYAPNGQTISYEAKGTTLIGNRIDRI